MCRNKAWCEPFLRAPLEVDAQRLLIKEKVLLRRQELLYDMMKGLQQQDVPIEPLFTMQLNTSAEMADCQEQALLSHIM